MSEDKGGLRGRVARQGEEAIGKVAQELLENPVLSRALTAAFDARERATRAQELAMSALNLPSAGDLERLTRRLRSVSQRLESIEDGLDRLEQRIDQVGSAGAIERRLQAIEEVMTRLEAAITASAAAPAPEATESPRPRRTRQSPRPESPPAPSAAPRSANRPGRS
jgi:chromosome segregation ATPase